MEMVDSRYRRSLRSALTISGVLGLLCAADMLLVTLDYYGRGPHALWSVAEWLPSWAVWFAAPPDRVTMLIVGSLCALLLVSGRWPIKVCATLAAAWFVYAQAAFGSGSRWARQMAYSFDTTRFWVGSLVGVAVLLAVAVLALVVAARSTPD